MQRARALMSRVRLLLLIGSSLGGAAAAAAPNVDISAPLPLEVVPISWDASIPTAETPMFGEAAITADYIRDDAYAAAQQPVYGPASPEPLQPADVRAPSFGAQVGAVKWELGALAAYMTAANAIKIARVGSQSFEFQNEGFFGKSTNSLGVDKFTHAFNTYVLADFLHWRLDRKYPGAPNTAVTAAALAWGLMAYSELFDAHKKSSGWSNQDVIANTVGAAFSALRNSVPGMKEKVDFRLLLIPNHEIYTFIGKEHFAQQRYLFALRLSGFSQLERSPLRFVELHAGYYGDGFTRRERDRGERPERKPFVGVGLNLRELLFPTPRSKAARIADTALEYLQVPYTAYHVH